MRLGSRQYVSKNAGLKHKISGLVRSSPSYLAISPSRPTLKNDVWRNPSRGMVLINNGEGRIRSVRNIAVGFEIIMCIQLPHLACRSMETVKLIQKMAPIQPHYRF
eukprot:scaffold583730_cov63-Attheya_sp.AAC.2